MLNSSADALPSQTQGSIVPAAAHVPDLEGTSLHEITREACGIPDTVTTQTETLAKNQRADAVKADDAAPYAGWEVEPHSLTSLAAELTAAVAVMGMVALNRRSNRFASDWTNIAKT